MIMTVRGIRKEAEGIAKIELQGKFVGIEYTSSMFLLVPWSQISSYWLEREIEIVLPLRVPEGKSA